MPATAQYAVGASAAAGITTAKAVVAIGAVPATGTASTETGATAVPDTCYFEKLECEVTSFVNSPTAVIWNLAKDAAGEYAITPEVTSTLVPGKATTTLGAFMETIECKRVKTALAVAGIVYLVARTDVATSTLTITKAMLFWRY